MSKLFVGVARMRKLKFTVAGLPTAWARAGQNGKFKFTPKKQAGAGAYVQSLALEALGGQRPLEGPLEMSVLAVWPWPKSMTENKRKVHGANWKTSRPDSDNIAKLICDALNGIAYHDDALIVFLTVKKQYGVSAFTQVSIEEIKDVER